MAAAAPARACLRGASAFLVAALLAAEPTSAAGGGAGDDAAACLAGQRDVASAAEWAGGVPGAARGGPAEHLLLQVQSPALDRPGASDGARQASVSWPWPWWPAPAQGPAHSPVLPRPAEPRPADGVAIRLATFNVYYKDLEQRDRVDGISSAIVSLGADIAVITESWSWNGKADILQQVRLKSVRNYAFCNGGNFQDKTWDGDIMYDADRWTVLEDGVLDLGEERGLSWASMRHRASGKKLLVYGVHPLCCGNEEAHLENAMALAAHLQGRPERAAGTPAVVMGDFNAFEDYSSSRLYKGETISDFGKDWQLSVAFDDAFRAPSENQVIDGSTFYTGVRFDYIYTERRAPPAFRVVDAWIWRAAPGGSDHHPLVADVVLLR